MSDRDGFLKRRLLYAIPILIEELEAQVAMDTQRFKEMEQHGLELETENKRMKKALHEITNMAHPQDIEIFKVAMEGLALEVKGCDVAQD